MRLFVLATLTACFAACGGPTDAIADQEAESPADTSQLLAQVAPASAARAPGRATNLQNLPADVTVLQRTSIPDPGVIAPMTALTALIPAGWSSRGGVVRSQGPCAEPYGVDWTAVSPDGLSSIAIFPTEVWQASNSGLKPDCRPGSYATARDYLTARIQATVPGVRILDYRSRPDLTKSAEERARAVQTMANNAGISMTAHADGGELLFAYTQAGVDMRGTAAVTAIFYESMLPSPLGGPPLRSLTGATLGSFAAAAPNGKLSFELIEASRRSVAPNPAWLRQLFALQNQLGAIAVQGTRDRSAIIVAGGAAATQANIAAFEQMTRVGGRDGGSGGGNFPGDAASDRAQRETIETIRGVETYHDPVDNSSVQLDANYDHAWRVTNQDAYILTKDPNFNPGQYGIEATQMGVVQ